MINLKHRQLDEEELGYCSDQIGVELTRDDLEHIYDVIQAMWQSRSPIEYAEERIKEEGARFSRGPGM